MVSHDFSTGRGTAVRSRSPIGFSTALEVGGGHNEAVPHCASRIQRSIRQLAILCRHHFPQARRASGHLPSPIIGFLVDAIAAAEIPLMDSGLVALATLVRRDCLWSLLDRTDDQAGFTRKHGDSLNADCSAYERFFLVLLRFLLNSGNAVERRDRIVLDERFCPLFHDVVDFSEPQPCVRALLIGRPPVESQSL